GEKTETVLRLREGATSKFDPKYDAQKFFESDLSLSTLTTDNVNTVINAFSLDNCVGSIPLVPAVPSGGSYSLSFQGLQSFDASLTITLTDSEENKIVDVQKVNEYRFTVADEKLANLGNRFRISFQGKGMISAPAVALTVDGTTLVSSATEGNQWYLNDALIEGETSEQLVAFDPGIYTVKIAQGGCTSEASHEVSEEDLNIYPAISVYPNPTSDKIWTRVKSENNNISVVLVNSAGMEIETKQLVGDGSVKEGEFDLIPHASGIYYLKILDGTKMFIRKVAKVK
ncbi:MAG TPA: T9SS type A sorting domain-containing protein, partial [Chryseolinea sp.]|nr:T9SS type A sorting domain-containing protein [Chryseolinea sp.]